MKNLGVVFIVLLLAGCDGISYKRGSGDMITRDFEIGNAERINLHGQFQVVLEEGSPGVEIIADDNLMDEIEVYEKRGNLTIREKTQLSSKEGITVNIRFRELNEIEIDGATTLKNRGVLTSDDLAVEISGAGIIKLEVNVNELKVSMDGAGFGILSGRADNLSISIDGAGNLNAYDLKARDCQVNLSGLGGAQVNVSGDLEALVSGVGGVSYKGKPENVRSQVDGLGKVQEADPDEEGITIDEI